MRRPKIYAVTAGEMRQLLFIGGAIAVFLGISLNAAMFYFEIQRDIDFSTNISSMVLQKWQSYQHYTVAAGICCLFFAILCLFFGLGKIREIRRETGEFDKRKIE